MSQTNTVSRLAGFLEGKNVNTADVTRTIEHCLAQLATLDEHTLRARPALAADTQRAIALLDRLVTQLRDAGTKQLYRVLEAVRAGYDTSDLIAAHLSLPRTNVARELNTLYRCGTLTRLVEPQRGPGRPSYRYRIVSAA
jgi:hypothetical protein